MSYIRTQWREGETPLSAQNFNNIEDGIEELQSQKVDKATGKTLSSNDYTTEEKTKLAGIAAGAEVNPDNATTSEAGLMSAADKTKLDGIAANATANPDAIKNITRSGTTFTATRANNTTFTFTQQDTTYGNATTSQAGLMSAADKTFISTFYDNFARVSKSATLNITTPLYKEQTLTITKDGYFPIALSGFTIYHESERVWLSQVAISRSVVGSCNVDITAEALTSAQGVYVTVEVLWVKVN